MYILVANVIEGKKILTVPVVYALCKHFTVRQYNEIFSFVKMKYFEYFGQKLIVKQFHIDCEMAVNAAIRLAFPDTTICYCNVHILRAITKHFKKYLGAHFYNTKIFLELFKVVTGAFYLDFENKELKDEFLKL